MPVTTKKFDCVEFKNQLQARLREEYKGLSDEEIECRRLEKLSTSDHPAAKLWRRLVEAESHTQKKA